MPVAVRGLDGGRMTDDEGENILAKENNLWQNRHIENNQAMFVIELTKRKEYSNFSEFPAVLREISGKGRT